MLVCLKLDNLFKDARTPLPGLDNVFFVRCTDSFTKQVLFFSP